MFTNKLLKKSCQDKFRKNWKHKCLIPFLSSVFIQSHISLRPDTNRMKAQYACVVHQPNPVWGIPKLKMMMPPMLSKVCVIWATVDLPSTWKTPEQLRITRAAVNNQSRCWYPEQLGITRAAVGHPSSCGSQEQLRITRAPLDLHSSCGSQE